MKKEVTITQLLVDIRSAKSKLDELYEKYLDPNSNEAKESQLMVTLYYPSNNLTIRGIQTGEKAAEILDVYQSIVSTLHDYERLLMIKEQVNAQVFIKRATEDENNIVQKGTINTLSPISYDMTIAQALIMCRKEIKDYYIGLFNKLNGDYSKAENALASYSEHALSQDKIENYVTAKLTNLKMSPDEATYSNFSKEYIEANTLKILDPLDIKKNVKLQMDAIKEFYESLSVNLAIRNASIKIWYDLDTDETPFWGFCDSSNSDTLNLQEGVR